MDAKKKRTGKRNFKRITYILGLGLLIAAAFQFPRLLFAAQDRERMGEVSQGSRTGLNFAALAENYETSPRKRLADFAAGRKRGRDFFITEAAFELSEEEKEEILRTVLTDAAVCFLDYAEAARRYSFMWSYQLKMSLPELKAADWKKYVVYDTEKVNFICWYIDVFLDDEHEMRILADAEDGTVYFLQGIRDAGTSGSHAAVIKRLKTKETQTDLAVVWEEDDLLAAWDRDHTCFGVIWIISKSVYESDWMYSDLVGDIAKWKEILTEEDPSTVVWGLPYEAAARQGFDWYEFVNLAWMESSISADKAVFAIDYGDDALEFQIEYLRGQPLHQDHEGFRIAMGLSDFAELIPELK